MKLQELQAAREKDLTGTTKRPWMFRNWKLQKLMDLRNMDCKDSGSRHCDVSMHCDNELHSQFLPRTHHDHLVRWTCTWKLHCRVWFETAYLVNPYCWQNKTIKASVVYACIFSSHSQWKAECRWVKEPGCTEAAAGLKWVLTAQSTISSGWTNSLAQNILCWLSDCRTILGHCHRCVTTVCNVRVSAEVSTVMYLTFYYQIHTTRDRTGLFKIDVLMSCSKWNSIMTDRN